MSSSLSAAIPARSLTPDDAAMEPMFIDLRYRAEDANFIAGLAPFEMIGFGVDQ